VRTDEAGSFLDDGTEGEEAQRELLAQGASFSGHERNRTVLQRDVGGVVSYVDVSAVSGLDSLGDGRAFAWIDFDRDGRRDVVVTHANEPRVQLFRNQIGVSHPVLAIRLVGAHTSSAPGAGALSNRDGIGALVEVESDGGMRRVELRAGEGLAAQNSAELLVGVRGTVKAVRVQWPSGKRSVLKRPDVAVSGRTAFTIRESD